MMRMRWTIVHLFTPDERNYSFAVTRILAEDLIHFSNGASSPFAVLIIESESHPENDTPLEASISISFQRGWVVIATCMKEEGGNYWYLATVKKVWLRQSTFVASPGHCIRRTAS